MVADLCVVGGYAQYAIRPARFLVPVPDGVDPAEAVCIPLAYLTAFQMLTRYRRLAPGAHDPRHRRLGYGRHGAARPGATFGLKAIGTCSAGEPRCRRAVRRHGHRLSRRRLRRGRARNGQAQRWHRRRCRIRRNRWRTFRPFVRMSRAGGLLVGYGSQTMAVGREGLLSAGLGLARLKLWDAR